MEIKLHDGKGEAMVWTCAVRQTQGCQVRVGSVDCFAFKKKSCIKNC